MCAEDVKLIIHKEFIILFLDKGNGSALCFFMLAGSPNFYYAVSRLYWRDSLQVSFLDDCCVWYPLWLFSSVFVSMLNNFTAFRGNRWKWMKLLVIQSDWQSLSLSYNFPARCQRGCQCNNHYNHSVINAPSTQFRLYSLPAIAPYFSCYCYFCYYRYYQH